MVATVEDVRRRARMALIVRARPRPKGFDPDARDADSDGFVQDGTRFKRPATPHLEKPGSKAAKGAGAAKRLTAAEREKRDKTMRTAYERGASLQQIADAAGVSAATVHASLSRQGVQLRPRGGTKAAKAPARKRTGSLSEGIQQAQESETRRELADRETAKRETARQIEQRRTPAKKATPAKATPAKATPPAKAATPRKAAPAASVEDHVAALDRLGTREEAQQYLANVRGQALRDLARRYSAHGGIGGGSAQGMRDGIVDATVGARLDSAAILQGATLPYGPRPSDAAPREATPAKATPRRLRDMTRLSDEALAAGRDAAPEVGYSTDSRTISDALAKFNATDLLRIADAFNITIPASARTAETRRGTIAFSAATRNARTRPGGAVSAVTREPAAPPAKATTPAKKAPAKAAQPRVSAAERRAEAELRELRAEQQMSSTPSRLNGRIMAAEQKLEDARAARATKAAAPRAPRKAAPSAEERLREKLLPPDEERRLRDERDRLSSRIRANRTAVSNGSEEAIASTERDRREQARISRRLKAHYDARDALQRQERETASATPRAATPAPTFNPNDRALLALADADSLEGDIGDPVLPPEVVNALINTSGPRPITPQGGLFSGSRRYELTPEGRERVAELLASMPSSDSPAGRAHESGLSAAAAKWRELSISDASELESARTRRDRVAILRNIMQTLARRPGTSREDREQAAALWARENAWLQTEGNRPVALDPALLADAAGLTGPDRESYIRWARGNPGDTITVSRWRVLRQMGMLNDEGAAPSEAGSTPVTDLSDYRRALDSGLPPRDASAYAAWVREHPGQSIAAWQASRRERVQAATFDPDEVADSLQQHVDRFTTLTSASRRAREVQAEGEAGIRQALSGLNLGQLRRVASRYRFNQRPPTGVSASEFIDWMLAQWRNERGRFSLQ